MEKIESQYPPEDFHLKRIFISFDVTVEGELLSLGRSQSLYFGATQFLHTHLSTSTLDFNLSVTPVGSGTVFYNLPESEAHLAGLILPNSEITSLNFNPFQYGELCSTFEHEVFRDYFQQPRCTDMLFLPPGAIHRSAFLRQDFYAQLKALAPHWKGEDIRNILEYMSAVDLYEGQNSFPLPVPQPQRDRLHFTVSCQLEPIS